LTGTYSPSLQRKSQILTMLQNSMEESPVWETEVPYPV